jgi:hypothetical protein
MVVVVAHLGVEELRERCRASSDVTLSRHYQSPVRLYRPRLQRLRRPARIHHHHRQVERHEPSLRASQGVADPVSSPMRTIRSRHRSRAAAIISG